MSRYIDADDLMERIKQAYEDMGVETHGIWNKQLAEIFKAEETDVEDIRLCLHNILGAVAQAPTVDIPYSDDWEKYSDKLWKNAYERGKAGRPQGKWIDAEIRHEDGVLPIQVCSECKTFYPLEYTGGGHRFCPSCGARMKGADND